MRHEACRVGTDNLLTPLWTATRLLPDSHFLSAMPILSVRTADSPLCGPAYLVKGSCWSYMIE
jgi:hypothetical protein